MELAARSPAALQSAAINPTVPPEWETNPVEGDREMKCVSRFLRAPVISKSPLHLFGPSRRFCGQPTTRHSCLLSRALLTIASGLRASPLCAFHQSVTSCHSSRPYSTAMTQKEQDSNRDKTEAHQYQAGNSTHRKEDEWKHREPYRIHDADEDFPVQWEGQCHCGKVQYQLRRDKPLAAKFCHCTTCQRLHGVSVSSWAPGHSVRGLGID